MNKFAFSVVFINSVIISVIIRYKPYFPNIPRTFTQVNRIITTAVVTNYRRLLLVFSHDESKKILILISFSTAITMFHSFQPGIDRDFLLIHFNRHHPAGEITPLRRSRHNIINSRPTMLELLNEKLSAAFIPLSYGIWRRILMSPHAIIRVCVRPLFTENIVKTLIYISLNENIKPMTII